jgi:hypothetical protein
VWKPPRAPRSRSPLGDRGQPERASPANATAPYQGPFCVARSSRPPSPVGWGPCLRRMGLHGMMRRPPDEVAGTPCGGLESRAASSCRSQAKGAPTIVPSHVGGSRIVSPRMPSYLSSVPAPGAGAGCPGALVERCGRIGFAVLGRSDEKRRDDRGRTMSREQAPRPLRIAGGGSWPPARPMTQVTAWVAHDDNPSRFPAVR